MYELQCLFYNTIYIINQNIPQGGFSLTIRLWAWNFYHAIVDEGEARINYHA